MAVRYTVVAVGRVRRGFYRTGCEHYLARLRNHAHADVVELRDVRGPTPDAVRAAEAERILARAEGRVIALDERGTRLRSRELAAHVDSLALRGQSRITLVLGGAEGLADAVRDRADAIWRLSDLTLPHELARLVLLEQLYRAETIRAGHPYHRD